MANNLCFVCFFFLQDFRNCPYQIMNRAQLFAVRLNECEGKLPTLKKLRPPMFVTDQTMNIKGFICFGT